MSTDLHPTPLAFYDELTTRNRGFVSASAQRRLRKATVSSRQRTWLSLTRAGRFAFRAHMAELQRLAAGLALAAE